MGLHDGFGLHAVQRMENGLAEILVIDGQRPVVQL